MNHENRLVKYLIDSEYFKHYALTPSVNTVLTELINKINNALNKVDNDKKMQLTLIKDNFKFKREDTTYFSHEIQTEIIKNYSEGVKITYSAGNFDITLNFYKMRNNKIGEKKILNYARYMLAWLLVVKGYESDDCVKNLLVDVFLTKHKKQLPEKREQVIGAKNVNTAYTYRCMHGSTSIKLYREEDLMKVFFHETFHTFNMDFLKTGKTEIREIFDVESSISIFESYCETWARVIHSLFLAMIQSKNNRDVKKIIKYFTAILCIESQHSLLQAKKVFEHMDLRLEDALENTRSLNIKFREESHVFSYYFVTSLLMININDFINYCLNNNVNILKFNPSNFDNYVILIKNSKNSLLTKKCVEYFNSNEINISDRNIKMVLFNMI